MYYIKEEFQQLKADAHAEYQSQPKPTKAEALDFFWYNVGCAGKLIFKEKEIIVFAFLQLVCIGLGYYLWVQVLNWIPEEVWESAKNEDGATPADVVLWVWSFVCVGITTYPLGLLTACMGAAHFLHESGQESTVAKCLKIVFSRAWPLWVFSWIDGWWTVNRIVDRLPSKKNKTSSSQKLLKEAIYQAWKLATLGVLPALIVGRSVTDSCKDSLCMVQTRFKALIKLRVAYVTICWFFGIASYVGAVLMVPVIFEQMRNENDMYVFYSFVGVPMLGALFFIQVIFRPIYILSSCRIYSNYLRENKIQVQLPAVSKFSSSLVALLILMIGVGMVFLYRDELGISALLATPYK